MCSIISVGPCTCARPARTSALVTLATAAASCVLVFLWWLTGPRVLGRHSDRPRRYARRVHAAGRIALVGLAAAAVAWPLATAVTLAVAAPAVGALAVTTRRRHRRALAARTARQVTATVRPTPDSAWHDRRRQGQRPTAVRRDTGSHAHPGTSTPTRRIDPR